MKLPPLVRPTFPPTGQGLNEAIRKYVPHLKTVWVATASGTVYVTLGLRWYAWLTFGVLHARVLRQARRVVRRYTSPEIAISVELS